MWKNRKIFQTINKLSSILFAVVLILKAGTVVYAEGILSTGQINEMFSMFKDMTNIYIKIAYGIIVLLFTVGSVKSGLSAQFARQFGMKSALSQELAKFAIGVLVFIIGILSYPVAEAVINRIVSASGGNIKGLSL